MLKSPFFKKNKRSLFLSLSASLSLGMGAGIYSILHSPALKTLFALKQSHDPQQRFSNEWYRGFKQAIAATR